MMKTRAIRLSVQEDKLIEEFLKKNSFFDFSSLARTAILNFIKQPSVQIQPIKVSKGREKSREVHS